MLRRGRGLLLRFVRRRPAAIAAGAALALPAAWIEFGGRPSGWIDAWWIEGLALVLGATGLALIWTGIVGVPADWDT